MNLSDLIKNLIPFQIQGKNENGASHLHQETTEIQEVNVQSITYDSRKVKQGSLFVCIEGFNTDGHQYVQQAVEKGAVAILAQKELDVPIPVILVPDTRRSLAILSDVFYQHPSHTLKVIGVTGTNGKTTITHLIEALLEGEGKRTGRIGTIGIKIGDHLSEVSNTTPESLELQQAYRNMLDHQCEYGVMEASSHAIHMGRLRGSNMRTMVFSNLTQDHLDYHGSMEEYKRAKGLAFAQLGNKYSKKEQKFAILNADDPATEYYRQITPAQVLTYGIDSPNCDVKGKNIRMTSQGITFTVECFKGVEAFHLQMVGKFNIYNALASIAVGITEGIGLSSMKNSLERVKGIPGRVEPVFAGQTFSVLVDYAHTPDSLKNVLQTIQEFAQGDIYCVIGCGGDRDRTKRPLMAKIAKAYTDFAIFTSDNPRSEDPEHIVQDMLAGINDIQQETSQVKSILDRRAAIQWAVNQANPQDVILIAGKGHETYQQFRHQTVHFDDRQVAIEAIQKRFNN